jgi:hypothetical protein
MLKVSTLAVLVGPLAACTLINPATNDANLAEAELPDGITLLESDQDQCSGTVRVDQGFIAGGNADEVVIAPGQDAAFEIEEERVVWTCIGSSTTTEDSVECPIRTSHVRITRPRDGDTFLVECFG